MIVTLMTREKYYTLTLPEKIGGQYWLKSVDEDGHLSDIIGIEGVVDTWRLKSNKRAAIFEGESSVKFVELTPLSVYNVVLASTGEKVCVYTEPVTDDRQEFSKRMLQSERVEFSVGRSKDNDIVFANEFVSSKHAKIIYDKNRFSIEDLDSTNGTFVNGRCIQNRVLAPGDTVFMMGLKMVMGDTFIAFNNPDGKVEVKATVLYPYISQPIEVQDDEDEEEESAEAIEFFYRSPRFKRDIETVEFKGDSPPHNAVGEEVPFMMVVGPSMTMGMASLTTAVFAINNAIVNNDIAAAIPSVVMSASMLLGTVMWPMLTKRYEKRRKRKEEALRQEKYHDYLDKISAQFADACAKQEMILRENHVDISECIERIQGIQRNLWERGPGQNDFLKLRLGLGEGRLAATTNYSERKFSLKEDNLEEELFTLCETPKILKDIPITLSLFDSFIAGVIGDRVKVREFAKGLVLQVAALYSYDEVKLVFLYDSKDEGEYGFIKWLPHVWDDEKKIRFIASDAKEVKEVSSYIEREIEVRKTINESDMDDASPYYIIFSMNKALSVRAEMIKQVLDHKKNIRISVVSCFEKLKDLPKECATVVELEGASGKLFDKQDTTGQNTSFRPDICFSANALELSVRLANIQLDTLAGAYKLPKMLSFLEMFEVGKVEHLNSLERWKSNDPTLSLETPVGIDTLGDLFKLDLHEKFHGPHGLVAGMTGSGKSEFIIAYILSLAVNYHPHEVAFILIDYKGGGMAKSFENLPHVAGIITNLDGAEVKRSLISIQSELKRRQAIFAETSKKIGVSNIDIYKYQKLYREGSVQGPLQHLFIISDEFAELKTQQPDFMAQLISAARIGRSLGVHLILATQKPSGVVDDQIWSNSRFRVCLKVQERSDSMDMLKRPDAAEIADTGRFYLQVGYNELFELGQSAWAGAPYYPAEKVVVEKDRSVVVIDKNGQPIRQAKPRSRYAAIADPPKQLDAITHYLQKTADSEGIQVRPLWLAPIPAFIHIEDIKSEYGVGVSEPYVLNPVIGKYDDPVRQKQSLLCMPISSEGNAIIYGVAGSGKTTFLTTMIYSLMKGHTPDEVNVYILDFASETLRAFAKGPHIGGVILSYESEKISNLFKLLLTEMERRKKLFADYGGDYRSYVEMSENKVPSIVVAINNFAAFTESYEEKEEAVSYLTREGTKYGIYFVLAATGTNAVRFRMLQNFKQMYVLQLNDESDYATVVGKTDGLYPSKCKGRGLVRTDALYEFQIAHVTQETVPFWVIREMCDAMYAQWNGQSAPPIPLLPDEVDAGFLAEHIDKRVPMRIPIGVEKYSLEVHQYDFSTSLVHLILSGGAFHADFTAALSNFMANQCGVDVMVLDIAREYTGRLGEKIAYHDTLDNIEVAINDLFILTAERNNSFKDAVQAEEEPEAFAQKVIVLNALSMLKGALSQEASDKLSLLLEKGEAKYGITVLIAETAKNMSGFAFEKWYKRHITLADGIWIGNGIAEQYQIKANKNTPEMFGEIDDAFGFSVVKGKPTMIKILNEKEAEVI